MPIEDKVLTYSVSLDQNNFKSHFRQIRLSLKSGGTAYIAFPKERPTEWLQFVGSATNLYMTEDEFADVYHLIQSESPVFFTALDLFGFAVGASGSHGTRSQRRRNTGRRGRGSPEPRGADPACQERGIRCVA